MLTPVLESTAAQTGIAQAGTATATTEQTTGPHAHPQEAEEPHATPPAEHMRHAVTVAVFAHTEPAPLEPQMLVAAKHHQQMLAVCHPPQTHAEQAQMLQSHAVLALLKTPAANATVTMVEPMLAPHPRPASTVSARTRPPNAPHATMAIARPTTQHAPATTIAPTGKWLKAKPPSVVA
jgi:hypothetical protein